MVKGLEVALVLVFIMATVWLTFFSGPWDDNMRHG